jgi:hypothetical protein
MERLLRPRRSQACIPSLRRHCGKVDSQKESQDCFQILPLEIRFNIAQYIPTPDFFSLRLSSKAMVTLFESPQFWRTRFSLDGKQGYFSYLEAENFQDWRLLYRYTQSSKFELPLILNDWKRQWLVNENLRDRYMMFEDPNCSLTYSSLPLEVEAPDGSFRWEIIKPHCMVRKREHLQFDDYSHIISLPKSKFGALQCGRCGQQGCFTKTHTIRVSYPILKIAVSVLVEGRRTYICGFDLIHGSNITDTQFGYRIPGKQVTLNLHGQILQGFQVARSGLAIIAIRPLTVTGEDGFYSWIGDPRYGVKKSVCLGLNEDIAAILGDFQVSL